MPGFGCGHVFLCVLFLFSCRHVCVRAYVPASLHERKLAHVYSLTYVLFMYVSVRPYFPGMCGMCAMIAHD